MKKIIYFLVILLTFFATLDGLRDTFLKDNPISYLKEVCSIALFFLLALVSYKRGVKIFSMTICLFNIFLLMLLFLSFLTTKFADITLIRGGLAFGGWSVWVKFFALYCLINALYLLRVNYSDVFYKIPKIYVSGAFLYSSLTLFFIISGLNSHFSSRNWSGRLSIGYPTMDCLILMVAFVFTWIFIEKRILKYSLMLLFLIVIVMQNTASGYIMLAVFLALNSFSLKGFYKVLPVISVIPLFYLGYKVYTDWYTYMGGFGSLFVDKINGFVFGSDTSSIDLRKVQIDTLMSDMNNYVIYTVFGKGGSEAYLVESTYYAFYGFCGLIGIILLLASLIFFMLKIPKSFKKKTFYCHSFFITCLFIISAAGLIGFYLFPMVFIYAYLVSIYSFSENEHHRSISEL